MCEIIVDNNIVCLLVT